MKSETNIEANLRQYILENFLFTDDQTSLSNSASLLEAGIIDSTGILDIIFFLEQAFGIKIEDEEMIPDNLESVNNIINFVIGKKNINND